MAPPRSPVALMDEMVEEVLLRIPPYDPKSLLRAALVCKQWRRIVSDRGFRRRFRELHRTPPMLGMFIFASNPRFISTCSFRPSPFINCRVIDARHGRVLLYTVRFQFEIWNPITGKRKKLPILPRSPKPIVSWNAAVLRRGGESLVVFVGTDSHEMFSYVYSSEAAAWSERVNAPLPAGIIEPNDFGLRVALELMPSVFVWNALYVMTRHKKCILKYDLGTREMSLVDRPPIIRVIL